jgi:ribosomal protein L28
MAYVCDNCGKSISVGRSQRHKRGVAGKRWRKRTQATSRLFKPNLQKIMVSVGSTHQSMLLCAKCIKKFKKEGKIPTYSKTASG